MNVFMLALSLLAAAGAVAAFGREYGVAYLARSSERSAFDAFSLASEDIVLPLSSRGMREIFQTCGGVQQGSIYALQPAVAQRAVDATCLRLASEALLRNPTYGAAHTIGMVSSISPQDIAEKLVQSYRVSASEAWNAELRLRKGLPLYARYQREVDLALDADIAFLMKSKGGIARLALLYQSDPTVRHVLVGVIDLGLNAEKAAFLLEIRRIGSN